MHSVTLSQVHCQLDWIYRGDLYHPSAYHTIDEWSNPWPQPFSVFFVEHGRIEIHTGQLHVNCAAGDCFLGAPGYRRHRAAQHTRLLSVGFRLTDADGHDLTVSGLNRRVTRSRAAALHRRTARLFNLTHPGVKSINWHQAQRQTGDAAPDFTASVRHAEALLGWLGAWLKFAAVSTARPDSPPASDARVSAVISILQHCPLDQKLPKERVCRDTGLSWRRVEQIFFTQLRTSPTAYFEQLRLAHARERLAHTPLTLKELAYELGFRHASHFTTWFRNLAGHTPGAYRASHAEPRRV